MRNRSRSREEARSAKKRTDSSSENPFGLDKSESGSEAATYWKRVRSGSEAEVSTFVYQNMYRLSLNTVSQYLALHFSPTLDSFRGREKKSRPQLGDATIESL